ncbi:hypothetical protein IMZ48_18720 [Candidatus Bathyarchaeota archaeon]|nr:hypothetical protein [Candidatus Bathyarchaeota archaeon]
MASTNWALVFVSFFVDFAEAPVKVRSIVVAGLGYGVDVEVRVTWEKGGKEDVGP